MQHLREWLRPVVYLANNWISLIGVMLVTTGGILWLFLLPATFRTHSQDPYAGILQFMVLPAVFFAGLGLIPLGIWRVKRKGRLPEVFPPLEMANPRFRRLLAFVGAATVANLVIGTTLLYGAVSYMESVSFCGQACHTVMKPEFTAYQNSPHARVACVECHIGPGANWFVKSKISGSWQVVSVTFNLYPRPIPTPIENLRPARETCEVCHWPQKYGGDRVRVINSYADDEKVTRAQSVLLMHIGGGNGYEGIHGAHMGPGVEIRYAHSDPQRQKIPWVEYRGSDGKTYVFRSEGHASDGPGGLPVRVMDCMDCHNRPSHSFELPGKAVDRALDEGLIDRTLPFARRTALEAIQREYATAAESEREIPARFLAFYEQSYPEIYAKRREDIERSARGALAIYSRNVFPEMLVKWGTYFNNIGHADFDGCFRCHDWRESKPAGRSITQDCDVCHKTLAQEEVNPKILSDLGLAAR